MLHNNTQIWLNININHEANNSPCYLLNADIEQELSNSI